MSGPDMAIAAERKRVARPTGSWVARTLDNPAVLAFLFMLPAASLLLIFLTYPLGLGIWLGFTDTRIGRSGRIRARVAGSASVAAAPKSAGTVSSGSSNSSVWQMNGWM